jgi:peptidylprolyl isomerase
MDRRRLIASALALTVAGPVFGQSEDPENTIYLDLKQGRVVIKLLPEVAPKTVAQIKTMARRSIG